MAYAAQSRALAILELLAHLTQSDLELPYVLVGVRFDSDHMSEVDRSLLSPDWRSSPPPLALAKTGDHWIRSGESAILRVPSVVVPRESCFLLNPRHPGFQLLEYEDPETFEFDQRLKPN